jgi:hypothetical protein
MADATQANHHAPSGIGGDRKALIPAQAVFIFAENNRGMTSIVLFDYSHQ